MLDKVKNDTFTDFKGQYEKPDTIEVRLGFDKSFKESYEDWTSDKKLDVLKLTHDYASNLKAKNRWDCRDGSAKETDLAKKYKDINVYTDKSTNSAGVETDSFVADEF